MAEPEQATKTWKKIVNTRNLLMIFVVASVAYGAYVQQAGKDREDLHWHRLVVALLSTITLGIALAIFVADAMGNGVALVWPRPWLLYYKRRNGDITDVPYFGQPYNIVSIIFAGTQTGLTWDSFASNGAESPIRFSLALVVFASLMLIRTFFVSFAGKTIVTATIQCGHSTHSCAAGDLVGNAFEGACDAGHEDAQGIEDGGLH